MHHDLQERKAEIEEEERNRLGNDMYEKVSGLRHESA
jgi:hypothetical protein